MITIHRSAFLIVFCHHSLITHQLPSDLGRQACFSFFLLLDSAWYWHWHWHWNGNGNTAKGKSAKAQRRKGEKAKKRKSERKSCLLLLPQQHLQKNKVRDIPYLPNDEQSSPSPSHTHTPIHLPPHPHHQPLLVLLNHLSLLCVLVILWTLVVSLFTGPAPPVVSCSHRLVGI